MALTVPDNDLDYFAKTYNAIPLDRNMTMSPSDMVTFNEIVGNLAQASEKEAPYIYAAMMSRVNGKYRKEFLLHWLRQRI